MFGQSKPSFGAPANTGFGFNNNAAASPFSNSFAKPATTGFQQTGFGQQNTSLFGGTQQASGGLFGANPTPAFGAPQPTTQSGFSGFQQPNTSVFGSSAPTQNTSIFGQSTAGGFGGAKPPTFGTFNTPQPSTSMFNQPSTANTTGGTFFGQPNQPVGGLFGANTTQSAFGATMSMGSNPGTSIAKYQALVGTDTLVKNSHPSNVNTNQHCITAMKEYESKSLEELRMEDYVSNRKGPQAGTSTGMFGAAGPSTSGVFGAPATQQTAFGQPQENKGLFGGTPSLGGFGQTNTFGGAAQTTNMFGSKPFGATPATSAPAFGFGTTTTDNTAGGGLFGKSFAAPAANNLFGTTPAQPATAFGQPNTSFGAPVFGQQNATPSLFGTTDNKPAFGLGATTSTGFGFGTNTNTMAGGTGLFNQKPATGAFGTGTGFGSSTSTAPSFSFNQPATGSLFGNNTFGAKPAGTTFTGFGQPATATSLGTLGATATGNLFGNNAQKPGGFFGSNTGTGTTGSLFNNFGSTATNNTGLLGQNTMGMGNSFMAPNQGQNNATQIHQQIMALTTNPYGDYAIFKDLKPVTGSTEESLKPTNPAAQKAILESNSAQFKVSSKTNSGIKVKPIGSVSNKNSLFDGLEEYDSTVDSFSVKPSARRLIIKPKSGNDSLNNSTSLVLNASVKFNRSQDQDNKENEEAFNNEIPSQMVSNVDSEGRVSWLQSNALEKIRQSNKNVEPAMSTTIQELVTPVERGNKDMSSSSYQEAKLQEEEPLSPKSTTIASQVSSLDSLSQSRNATFSPDESNLELIDPYSVHPTGIVLKRAGYFTIPSLDELCSYLSEDGSCVVENFTIGREGYGNVFFNETMDVSNLNLDEIVFFRNKEVIIYPLDDNKPPVGKGLNRKAQITLDQVWPLDKTNHDPIKDPERLKEMDYEAKLRRACYKHETRFIDYRPETGSWVFRVNHFSKYGLSDTDEEEEVKAPTDPKKPKLTKTGTIPKQPLNVNNKEGSLNRELNEKQLPSQTQVVENLGLEEDTFDMDFMPSFQRNDITSPSSVVASGFGIDSHKVQLMKASFFVDDEFDRQSMNSSEYNLGRDSPDQMVPIKQISRISSIQSLFKDSSVNSQRTEMTNKSSISLKDIRNEIQQEKPQIMKSLITLSKPLPLIIKPKINEVRYFIKELPEEKSIFERGYENCFADTAAMMNRRFKTGYGPRNSMTFLTNVQESDHMKPKTDLVEFGKIFKGRSVSNLSSPLLGVIRVSSGFVIPDFRKSIEDHLKIQLNFSTVNRISGSNCPQMTVSGGNSLLLSHFEQAKQLEGLSEYQSYLSTIWALNVALWGDEEILDGQSPTSHLTVMRRRELLSGWLEEVVIDEKEKNKPKADYLEHLLSLLFCHKVEEACEMAFNNDDINLSLLLSQVSGGPVVRQLIQHQLSSWQDVQADTYIDPKRLKAYMLVAGIPLLSSSHGVINIFEDVDWLKGLAINLWYLCSPTLSITDALLNYERDFTNQDEMIVQTPNPPYLKEFRVECDKPIQDVRFHLLKLYSKRSHALETLLNPATHTQDPMDFRLSWILLQTLKTLGYNHCSKLSEAQITVSFASQLENYDMWHWAIFVLMHLPDQRRRESSIRELLYRHIQMDGERNESQDYREKEDFIIEELDVPIDWIYEAKAIRAGVFGKHHEQAKYYLKANDYNLAHSVIMDQIAPDAIINDETDYLKSLLDQFDDPKKILNWRNQGQIFIDYISLNEKVEHLKDAINESEIDFNWDEICMELTELCSRINLFPCPTSKHRLCQSEIAQKLACIVGIIVQTSPEINRLEVVKLALEKLPLPQEYVQNELQLLNDSIIVDEYRNRTEFMEYS